MGGIFNFDLSSLAKSISEPITAAIQKGEKLAGIEQQVEKQLQDFFATQNAGQVEINKIEAASPSIFKSGWRPFIGWVCAFAILWSFAVQPILQFYGIGQPKLETAGLMELVMAMLGMAGIRSFDKYKNITK